jgi:hypothetical protein
MIRIEKTGASLNKNLPYAMCKEHPQSYKKNWYEEKKDYVLEKLKINYQENYNNTVQETNTVEEIIEQSIIEQSIFDLDIANMYRAYNINY